MSAPRPARTFFPAVALLTLIVSLTWADSKPGALTSDSSPLGSDNGRTVSLVPREVFIGDEAVLTFPSATLVRVMVPGERVELGSTDLPTPTDAATVLAATLTRGPGADDEVVVRLSFVPWNVGTLTLPSIAWQGVVVVPPAVAVASLVDRTGTISLEPPRPPLLVPGTTWLLYGIALSAILGSIALWVFARRVLALMLGDPALRRASRRVRTIRGEFSRMERRIRRVEPLPWYAGLSLAMRRYLALVHGAAERRFDALTPAEIEDSLAEVLGADPSRAEAREWLETFDEIRFSGRSAEDARRAHLTALRGFVGAVERSVKGGSVDGRL